MSLSARFSSAEAWTPLFGCWMYPLRVFGPRPTDPMEYLKVIEVVDVVGTDVAVTHGGGIFVRNCGQYETSKNKYELVALLNLLLCEFAFWGIYSEPFTFRDLQEGRLIGFHAGIFGGFGEYAHKTTGPVALLEQERDIPNRIWPPNFYWHETDPGAPKHVRGLPNALALRAVSESLPAIVLAACHHFDRDSNAEAILSSFIASEQILAFLWVKYIADLTPLVLDRRTANAVRNADPSRKESLKDHRSFSASQRAELLLTAGILPPDTYALFQAARRQRNAWAHRAKIDPNLPKIAFDAMVAMMSLIGITQRLPSWMAKSGGNFGRPQKPVEPEFPFRCGPKLT
jgi:hypothetical protein